MDPNSQRGAVKGTMRSDLKHKIFKLEAESRQLCHNLRELQKNRAKLTDEAVALSLELEGPVYESDQAEETIHSESDCIRVLLDAKQLQNQCSTMCTCSDCDDYSAVAGDADGNYLEDSLRKTIFVEEPEEHEHCYMCYRNGATASEQIDKNSATVASKVRPELKPSGSQEKVNFCSTCSVQDQPSNTLCEVCDSNIDRKSLGEVEERCRGGMDQVESELGCGARSIGGVKNERKKRRVCEGCECNLCALRNVDGASPPCLMMCESCGILSDGNDGNTIDELVVSSGDAPIKLQQICKVEKLREVLEQLKNRNHSLRKMLNDCDCFYQPNVDSLAPEKPKNEINYSKARDPLARSTSGLIATVKILQQKCRTKDGMILALAEALKNVASSDQTDRILTKLSNPCTADSPIRDMDRCQLWKYLQMESPRKDTQPDDRVSVEDKTSKRNIFASLLVLLFIIFSQIFRHHEYLASHSVKLLSSFKQVSEQLSVELPKCLVQSATVIKHFSGKLNAQATKILSQAFVHFGNCLNFFSSHLTYMGAIFGSLSFARTLWSLGKEMLSKEKEPPCSSLLPKLRNIFRVLKFVAVRAICYTKSQYHFFSYISCLALGFLASRIAILADRSFVTY